MITFPKTSPAEAALMVGHLGVETSVTNVKQMQFMLDAYLKFVERNAVYVDLWKEYGVEGCVNDCKSKAARLERLFLGLQQNGYGQPEHPSGGETSVALLDAFYDSAFDIATYAGFAARNMHSRRLPRTSD